MLPESSHRSFPVSPVSVGVGAGNVGSSRDRLEALDLGEPGGHLAVRGAGFLQADELAAVASELAAAAVALASVCLLAGLGVGHEGDGLVTCHLWYDPVDEQRTNHTPR